MNFIFEAILLGVTLAMMPGPIFVTLIETALSYSKKEGFFVGFGIWLSDIAVMALCLIFIDQISETIKSENFKIILALVGGTTLIAMGVNSALKKRTIVLETEKKQSGLALLGYSSKGFLINTLNPFTFIFWLGVITTYSVTRNLNFNTMVIFLATIIGIIIVTDIVKIFLADKVSQYITGKALDNISKISGIGLIIFGIILMIRPFI